MGKEGKKSKMREGQVEEMGVPLKDDLLVDEMDAADISPSLVQDGENMEQQAGASGSGKNKSKSDKKEKKRKEAVAFALAITGNEASKPSKKQKVGKQLTTGEEGGVVEVKTRSGKDEGWDKRIEGQKFGEWSPSEVTMLKDRIRDWAAAHGCLDDWNNENYEFLFKRRQKQGGRGAKLADSERKAFLEIATDFPTRNPKQIYGYVSRHFDSSNYKGKWTDEEKESLTRLVGERGERWKEIGAAMGRPGYACRDKWRMMRNNPNKGDWSEHEVTLLKEYVQEYFDSQQAGPGRGAGEGQEHLPLLDNINWKSISLKLGTRNENMAGLAILSMILFNTQCDELDKRSEGIYSITLLNHHRFWAKGEDKIMLEAIRASGAEVEHAVPWETLVPNRNLSQIKRRYKLMKQSITGHNKLSFDELLEKLVQKYLKDDDTETPALPNPSELSAAALPAP